MATFLFLVSVTATTLLLLAIAVDEIVTVTRRLFSRWSTAGKSAAAQDLRYHVRPAHAVEDVVRAAKVQLKRVLPQGRALGEEGDWDRAA
jgi:hypothetical protein